MRRLGPYQPRDALDKYLNSTNMTNICRPGPSQPRDARPLRGQNEAGRQESRLQAANFHEVKISKIPTSMRSKQNKLLKIDCYVKLQLFTL